LLEQAVPSTFTSGALFTHEDEWKAALGRSHVRLQWDPDHLPTGDKCERRAVQLGLRGDVLEAFGRREIVEIIDASDFVVKQSLNAGSWKTDGKLITPVERVYVPADPRVASHIGLNQLDEEGADTLAC
jgi:hypothetical protein